MSQGLASSFRTTEEPMYAPPSLAEHRTSLRKFYQKRTRYYLMEARRAFAFAAKEKIMKDRKMHLDWMMNAIYLLSEAVAYREMAQKTKWNGQL